MHSKFAFITNRYVSRSSAQLQSGLLHKSPVAWSSETFQRQRTKIQTQHNPKPYPKTNSTFATGIPTGICFQNILKVCPRYDGQNNFAPTGIYYMATSIVENPLVSDACAQNCSRSVRVLALSAENTRGIQHNISQDACKDESGISKTDKT